MTHATRPRFCSQCGAKVQKEAGFCVECGTAVGAPAGRPTGSHPQQSPERMRRLAPLIVAGTLLCIGAVLVAIGYQNQPPPNQPLGRGGGKLPPPSAAGQQLPDDHPPVEIPDEVLKVIVRMEKLAIEHPEDLDAWKQLAFVQYRAGQIQPLYLDKAEESYRHVLEKNATDLDALRGLGNVAYDHNAPGKALEFYKQYLEIKPDDKSVRTDMGTMLLAAEQPEQAIQIYTSVLQEDPTFFQAQFNLAVAYRSAGKGDLAIAALQRAKDVAPDDDSRKRVEALLAHVGVGGGAGQAAPQNQPGAGGTFRDAVEAVFRSHPIVGPRIDAFRWESDQQAQVVLREFPMAGMPPMVREKFISRLASGIRASKERFAFKEKISIDIVDATSGDTMVSIAE